MSILSSGPTITGKVSDDFLLGAHTIFGGPGGGGAGGVSRGNGLLYGGSSNDVINAKVGNDGAYGGTGDDRLQGDSGGDSFTTALRVTNVDHITDYNLVGDRIDIDNAVFTGLAAAFRGNTTGLAQDASETPYWR